MNVLAANNWVDANHRYLAAVLALTRHTLEQHIARLRDSCDVAEQPPTLQQALDEAAAALPAPAALATLCEKFVLSPFERDILLLCAGVELDGSFTSLCVAAQSHTRSDHGATTGGHTRVAFPTFSLALAAFPHAHWDALTPIATLRRSRLIEVGSGSALALSPLRIDERILHYLTGVTYLDARLSSMIIPLHAHQQLVPSHQILAQKLTKAWQSVASFTSAQSLAPNGYATSLPIVQLYGEDMVGKLAIATTACTALGLNLEAIPVDALPTASGELSALVQLWQREAILSDGALLLECHDSSAIIDVARITSIARMMQQVDSPLIIASRERLSLTAHSSRPLLSFEVRKPDRNEQRDAWRNILGERRLNGHVETLVSQFDLSTAAIYAASIDALNVHNVPSDQIDDVAASLWDACRAQARPQLGDLAQRIEPIATWDDLVLPEAQVQVLHEIAMHVRQHSTVYETWGFSAKGSNGQGISALFAGASGTGKTLAAEVLARELRLDLYRIDLSSVVSKYIGETEKNLRRVFDAAEEGGAILLFDEADALFGKRSEVKDSHDRYANIEVSYLLQRMEAYHGLAILTTNLRSALDTAFLRRLRFIVNFPFPNSVQRAAIWHRIFPQKMPTENLDLNKLARLNVAGGNIRNIALNAAFLAADAREPVRMAHLLRATYTEYAKLEKPLTEAEIGGWI